VLEHSVAIGPAAIIEVLELQLAEETSDLFRRLKLKKFGTVALHLYLVIIVQS
jgi:hypothetical protein